METDTMGRVVVTATIENQYDLHDVSQGQRKPEDVRRIVVTDALVDTGSKMLALPRRMIDQLGLDHLKTTQLLTSAGHRTTDIYGLVKLTIMDRDAPLDVAALPDECPVLIGYIALEQLGLVVDPVKQQLVGDPFHKGQNLIDMF